jgi:hypothetical protein
MREDLDLKAFAEKNDNFLEYEIAENRIDQLVYFDKYQDQMKFILKDKFMENLQKYSNYISYLSNSTFIFLILYLLY